jgi:hemolysin activation/secretion protein
VKVVVYDAGTKDISYGAYYDNSGMSAYGANRYAVNVRIPGRLLKGDDLDGVAMHSNGMDYQQVGYELPVVPLASRFQVWGSQMRYQVGSGVHGYVRQVGATMSRLIYGNANVSLLGWLEYADKRQWDWLANDTSTGDKGVTSWRLGLTGNRLLSNGDSLLATAGVRYGQLDLSRLPAVLVQDAASAQTQGEFVTMDWRLAWSGLLSRSSQVDFRAAARGQFASKNLDTGEKFILGGPSGVRAYGSVEGMGDSGQIINLEAGYLLAPRVRGSIFYDAGWITRYHTAWETGTTPNRYGLQGWGIGISTSWRTLDARLTWAQQIGTNSGLNAQGQDSEGLTRRDRLWATLSWRI